MFGNFDEIFNKDTVKPSESMSPCWRCGSNCTYIKLIAFCEPALYSPRCINCGAMLTPEFYEDYYESVKAWNDKFQRTKHDNKDF